MNMKMNIKQKANPKNFDNFYRENYSRILNYFKKKVDLSEAEDLTNDVFIKFLEETKNKEYPIGKWVNLLSVITKRTLIDYYRLREKERKHIINNTLIIKNKEINLIDLAGEDDPELEKLIEDDDLTKKKEIWMLRGILLSPHRSLQEIMLISLTPSCKLLTDKIKNKFIPIKKRYDEKGLAFEVFSKNEELSNLALEKLQNDICNFNSLVFKIAEELKINDLIGFSGLKILLLSSNPLKDWYFLSQTKKVKSYLSFDEKGKLYKKKTIKRPYFRLFRDFMALSLGGIKKIKEFIKKEAKEKINHPSVSEEYIKDWYRIGVLNSEIIKKQKWGRKDKKGLKDKIKEYDLIIQKNLKEI